MRHYQEQGLQVLQEKRDNNLLKWPKGFQHMAKVPLGILDEKQQLSQSKLKIDALSWEWDPHPVFYIMLERLT